MVLLLRSKAATTGPRRDPSTARSLASRGAIRGRGITRSARSAVEEDRGYLRLGRSPCPAAVRCAVGFADRGSQVEMAAGERTARVASPSPAVMTKESETECASRSVRWLDGLLGPDMLKPAPEEALREWKVSPRLNRTMHVRAVVAWAFVPATHRATEALPDRQSTSGLSPH